MVKHSYRDGIWYTDGEIPITIPDQNSTVKETPDPQQVFQKQKIAAGRRAWTLLHNYRGCDPQWVELWEYFIPAGGCGCKEGYKAIIKDQPFDYSSPEKFFESGVVLHNAVNQKLIDQGDSTKKIITLEEAKEIWNRKE
jgi:hypothetical protein